MNAAIAKLYDEWYAKTGSAEAAATLTAAELQANRRKEKSDDKPTSNLLTIKQAAREFNISERALYRLKDLHRRNGKSVRIKRQELANHLDGTSDLLD